jgi:hypothetical protein
LLIISSGKNEKHRWPVLSLAWLSVCRRKRRTIISATILAFVLGSSTTLGSTIQQFPVWVGDLSSSSPTVLLAYEKTSPFIGLLPVNSTLPMSDLSPIQQIYGVQDATPLIVKDIPTSLSPNPSLVVGLDVNFWQMGLGLDAGRWPQPNSTQAVVTRGSQTEQVPLTVRIMNQNFQVVGVATTANLVLVHSIIMSYAAAQNLFSLHGLSSVFIISASSRADLDSLKNQIASVDSRIATVDLSTSGQILNAVSGVVGAISGVVVLANSVFTFAILTALTISSINSRRWEYGLVSSYGSSKRTLRLVLFESWLMLIVAALPAFLISVLVLGLFTYYFNILFGNPLFISVAFQSAISNMINLVTIMNFVAAFVAGTFGAYLASRTILRRQPSELLSDIHA